MLGWWEISNSHLHLDCGMRLVPNDFKVLEFKIVYPLHLSLDGQFRKCTRFSLQLKKKKKEITDQ